MDLVNSYVYSEDVSDSSPSRRRANQSPAEASPSPLRPQKAGSSSKSQTPNDSSRRTSPDSSRPSTLPSPVPTEVKSTADIYIESRNDAKHKLIISKHMFEEDPIILIDSNNISAIGKLKSNYVEIDSDGVGIMTHYLSYSARERIMMSKLKKEVESKYVNYKGARVPVEAYKQLIAQDALNAFRDSDDDDDISHVAAPRPRQQRKRAVIQSPNAFAPPPKRIRIQPKNRTSKSNAVRRARKTARPIAQPINSPATPLLRLAARLAARNVTTPQTGATGNANVGNGPANILSATPTLPKIKNRSIELLRDWWRCTRNIQLTKLRRLSARRSCCAIMCGDFRNKLYPSRLALSIFNN
ncbi:unnamed protein product [Caenorhabditis angaria]|uniref:Uncharacterized protein n=1 Tax=Caenorhabditis angaria TaxID=860376 RepID=A0A9P1N3H0_9PELO|nr:unnamed protein product [Caenorhabditis angaria]